MKEKRISIILLVSALLIFLAGSVQQTHAAIRIVELQVPGCV